LLKKRFSELSLPQQTALKIFYGLSLTNDELRIWSAFQGGAKYDHLGYITDDLETIPYTPQEYSQGWLVLGRRWGKTDSFSSTLLAYEATCGGHEDYIRKGQEAMCFLIAQDKDKALADLPLIRATLEASPLLKKEIKNDGATYISLKNGITIGVSPPVAKTVRGYAVPVIVMDEVGVWYTTSDAANPDYEIERAVKFAQIQFPHFKRVGTSTPWAKEGLLWKYHEAGTEGRKILDPAKRKPFRNILVLHAPTAVAGHKLIRRDDLQREFDQDPEAFEREAMARFTDAISGFLNGTLVHTAIDKGVFERAPKAGVTYMASLDPAFRRDAFGFTIVHQDADGLQVDVVRRWKAPPGQALNPADVLDEIVPLLKSYKIFVTYSDQHHLDSLMQLALDRGFAIEGVPFTRNNKASIFGSLQQLINQRRIKLLDAAPGTVSGDAAQEMIRELLSLEKRNTQGGGVQISAPNGKHDDMACVLALAAYKATWLMPYTPSAPQSPVLSMHEKIQNQIKRKRLNRTSAMQDEVYD
jgi:hypothetical protein